MKTSRLWTLAGLPLLLAACGGEVEEADVALEDPAVVVAPAPMDTGMAGMVNTVALQPLNDSGTTGEATLNPMDGQVQVMVRLMGAPEGERPGHIHSGTCDNLGGVVQPLEPVVVGADGTGTSTSTVPLDMATLTGGQHVINYHGEGGTPIACGPITAHQM